MLDHSIETQSRIKKKIFFSSSIRKSGKKINFTDKKNQKSDIYKNKNLFKIDEIDVDEKLVSKNEPYGTNQSIKYFIGYNIDDAITMLRIKLPQMVEQVKWFDSNKTKSLKVTDKKLLRSDAKIWGKDSNLMDLTFDSELVSGENDKYTKTKKRIYRDKVNTNLPKENSSYKCFSSIMLDFVIIANKKCYPETHFEECKYDPKKARTENLINNELELSSSDDECDNE